MFCSVGKVLDEVEYVGVVAVKEDERLEATELEGQEVVLLHLPTVRFVVGPSAESSAGTKKKKSIVCPTCTL